MNLSNATSQFDYDADFNYQFLGYLARQVISLLCLFFLLFTTNIFSAYGAPTNVNEITDLFPKQIENQQNLESFIDQSKQQAESGIGSKSALKELEAKEHELEHKIYELNSINANSLENAGQTEQAKEEHNYYETLEVDHNDPKILHHKADMDKIADASAKLVTKLIEGLRELDVDCKQVAGNKEVDPEYYIDIKKEPYKDTIYNKHICEQRRNRYNCQDILTIKCIKTGFQYKPWEYRTIRFNGHALHNEKVNWGFAIHWKTKRWGWHITPYHPGRTIFGWPDQVDSCWRDNPVAIINDARHYIAMRIGAAIEQVREDVTFPASGRGVGNINPVYCRWRVVWDEYEFGYWYRDRYSVCEAWSEDWNEVCKLQ